MKLSILCIGGVNQDRKLLLQQPQRKSTSNPVETVYSAGGVARNVAENLARLGCPVQFLGAFGNDAEGPKLRTELERLHIDCSMSPVIADKRTGSYISVHGPDGEMLHAYADMEIAGSILVEHLEPVWSQPDPPQAVFLDTNCVAEVVAHVIEQCHAASIPLHVDPVSVVKTKKLPFSLEGVDTLYPNLEELQALTGREVLNRDTRYEACVSLVKRGVKRVILSLGPGGLTAVDAQECLHFDPSPVKVVDVTGAGDALTAGFMWGSWKGKTLTGRCRMGMRLAERTLASELSVVPSTNIMDQITGETL